MPQAKPPDEERSVIVRQPEKRPYGTRARAHVQTASSFGDTEGVSLLLKSGAVVTIEPRRKAPWEAGDKFLVTLEGFPTAAAAEAAGRRLVQALLWTAISMNFAIGLEYMTYEPTTVFDRTQSPGARVEAFGTVGWSIDRVLDEIRDAYSALAEPDPALLLSMEIFAGARLEISQRARFLAIVSALEPLAGERSLGSEVTAFVDACTARLDAESAISNAARASLRGRLRQLRTESIRQAILRVIREAFPEKPQAALTVDEAYAVRSQIVHQGRPNDLDVDLESFGRDVSAVLRDLYSVRLKRKLYGVRSGTSVTKQSGDIGDKLTP
jgi:hypothetical protein